MAGKRYDAACFDLADRMLERETIAYAPDRVERLAQHIQDAVDEFLEGEMKGAIRAGA